MPVSDRCTFIAFPNPCCPFEVNVLPFSEKLYGDKGIMTSHRYHRYYSLTEVGVWTAKWDFLTPGLVDYLYIARLDCTENLIEVILRSSDDDIIYTDEFTFTAPFDLVGPREEDFFECFDALGPHRYWQIQLTMAPTAQVCFSKIYFGTLFDMGLEPSVDLRERHEPRQYAEFRSTSNIVRRTRTQHPTSIWELEYVGIDNATAQEFLNKVAIFNNRFALLVNSAFPELLNSDTVIHGRIEDPEITRTGQNTNEIKFTFREMVG